MTCEIGIEPFESSLKIIPLQEEMPNRVMITARREGELVGHLCITFDRGYAYGHDTKCWDTDKWTALRLWKYARKFLKSLGIHSVIVHINSKDKVQGDFWERRGFTKSVIYQGEI